MRTCTKSVVCVGLQCVHVGMLVRTYTEFVQSAVCGRFLLCTFH